MKNIIFLLLIFGIMGGISFVLVNQANAKDSEIIDYETADFETLSNLAKQGDFKAEMWLGSKFYKNEDFEKLLEMAENGDVEAMRWVGVKYASGEGVEHDILKAEEWYIKAAEQGNAAAQNNLGNLYIHGGSQGDGRGVSKDIEKGMEWLNKAAEQGNPPALNNVALFYTMGMYVPKDVSKAIALYTKAAEQDDEMAIGNLAMLYYSGESIPKDSSKALFWFEKGAKLGNRHAQSMLDEMKGIKTESKSRTIELTSPVDREDFLELYDLSEYIRNDKRECKGAGYSATECICELSEEYQEMSVLVEEMVEKHPEWKGNRLRYKGERAYDGSIDSMQGKMINTSISASLSVMQNAIDRFEKKLCSKE